jgi:hypothetical protein
MTVAWQPGAAPDITAAWQPGAGNAQAGSAAAPGNGMQRVAVIDPNGFEKPMPAAWVQVPAGWRTEGGVVWNQQAPCGEIPSYQWQAVSPDGLQRLQMLPSEGWTWDNLGMEVPAGSCPRWPITDVRGYLQSYVQRHRPGARVLDYRARNDLIRTALPPPVAQTRLWKEGGEILISNAGPQGEVRESIMAVVQFTEITVPGVMPGEVRKYLIGNARTPVVATAPSGQLDLALATHFVLSARPDDQWQARMIKHNGKIAGQNIDGIRARGEVTARTTAEIAENSQSGYESSVASSERTQRLTVDGLMDVTRYRDPTTGEEVQLDKRYDHGYRAQDGTYFQTDQPVANPYLDLGIEAEEMERIE